MTPKSSLIVELESTLYQFFQAMNILEKNLVVSMERNIYHARHFRY